MLDKKVLDEFKEKVDIRCKEASSFFASFTNNLHGADLRNKMIDMVSLLARFGELNDKIALKSSEQKRLVDLVESLALQSINSDPNRCKLPATIKPYYLENEIITLHTGEQTSLFDEKIKLEHFVYATNRYKDILELIKTSIMVAQSSLSFDRTELKNINFT